MKQTDTKERNSLLDRIANFLRTADERERLMLSSAVGGILSTALAYRAIGKGQDATVIEDDTHAQQETPAA